MLSDCKFNYFVALLADECDAAGNPQYAALCWLHAAKCQELLKDKQRQMYYLIKAGRKFISIEMSFIRVGCPSVGNENFQACELFQTKTVTNENKE